MKKTVFTMLIAAMSVLLSLAAGAAVLSPGLDVIANEYEFTVGSLTGETVEFTKEQFSQCSGKDSWEKIKIAALPDEKEGVLRFGDVEATVGQVIGVDNISKLSFEPCDNVSRASFKFVFDDSYTMTCNVSFSDKVNSSPEVVQDQGFTVFLNTSLTGDMAAYDKNGDELKYEVIEYPKGGELNFNSSTGEYNYTAGSRVMNDSFTYRVKDTAGEYSKTGKVNVNIRENRTSKVFTDMERENAVTAAAVMTDKGYMSCIEDKSETYFSPDSQVSRLDFLVTCMNVLGADNIPTVSNTGFDDDESISEKYKGYVYSASKLGIINGVKNAEKTEFSPAKAVTKAEAAVMLNNIIGYKAETVKNVSSAPNWAEEAVCAMYELGICSDEGLADPISKEECADMLYKVSCMIGE